MSDQDPQQQSTAPAPYSLEVDADARVIRLSGTLRLNGVAAYEEIATALTQNATAWPTCTLDLTRLNFLNSSGIAMLSRFVIDVRNNEDAHLSIIGSNAVAWQGKSLRNLQRLMPRLVLELK